MRTNNLVKTRIVAKAEYLEIEEVRFAIFMRDGHIPMALSIKMYRGVAKHTVLEKVLSPTDFVCRGATRARIVQEEIRVTKINFRDNPKGVNKVYPWLMKAFPTIRRVGSSMPWKGIIVPIMVQRWDTINERNNARCVWEYKILNTGEVPAMILTRVDGKSTECMDEKVLKRAAGGMFEGKCIMTPRLGTDRCIFA